MFGSWTIIEREIEKNKDSEYILHKLEKKVKERKESSTIKEKTANYSSYINSIEFKEERVANVFKNFKINRFDYEKADYHIITFLNIELNHHTDNKLTIKRSYDGDNEGFGRILIEIEYKDNIISIEIDDKKFSFDLSGKLNQQSLKEIYKLLKFTKKESIEFEETLQIFSLMQLVVQENRITQS